MNEHFDISKYVTIVRLDETTDGNYCFIAFHPELPTVISQGSTAEEAKADLVEATEMTVAYLVANGLSVPEPMALKAVHSSSPVVEQPVVKFADVGSLVFSGI